MTFFFVALIVYGNITHKLHPHRQTVKCISYVHYVSMWHNKKKSPPKMKGIFIMLKSGNISNLPFHPYQEHHGYGLILP